MGRQSDLISLGEAAYESEKDTRLTLQDIHPARKGGDVATTDIRQTHALSDFDRAAIEARAIAYDAKTPIERKHWMQIAWALETRAMEARMALARRIES